MTDAKGMKKKSGKKCIEMVAALAIVVGLAWGGVAQAQMAYVPVSGEKYTLHYMASLNTDPNCLECNKGGGLNAYIGPVSYIANGENRIELNMQMGVAVTSGGSAAPSSTTGFGGTLGLGACLNKIICLGPSFDTGRRAWSIVTSVDLTPLVTMGATQVGVSVP